jgi:hypothetical protein
LKPLFFTVMLMAAGVNAQQISNGTVDVYFQQLSSDGVLNGCSLVFTSLVSDTAYSKGAQIVMNGSIAIRIVKKGQISFTGKLGTKPFLDTTNKWIEPANFYFSSDSGTTSEAAKVIDSDTQGYKLLIGNAFEGGILELLKDILRTGEFTVGFNRKPGGQDVYTLVKVNTSLKSNPDGTGEREQSNATPLAFNRCLGRLTEKVQQQLK